MGLGVRVWGFRGLGFRVQGSCCLELKAFVGLGLPRPSNYPLTYPKIPLLRTINPKP